MAGERSVVDIVIRAKNGHEATIGCLWSLRGTEYPHRLTLVDDGSRPFHNPDVDFLVRCRDSRGAVSATNLGLAVALQQDGDYVLVLDNDARVPVHDPGWLGRFVAELEDGGPKVAAIGATSSKVNPPQHILTVPQTYTGDWQSEHGKGVKANPPVIWFVSFCVLLRKSVVRELGFWDERFNPGNWEDTDYSFRIREAGYLIHVARSVYLHHDCHATFGSEVGKLLRVNQGKFLHKWGAGRCWDRGYLNRVEMAKILNLAGH